MTPLQQQQPLRQEVPLSVEAALVQGRPEAAAPAFTITVLPAHTTPIKPAMRPGGAADAVESERQDQPQAVEDAAMEQG
jgi:hypothetical protein